MNQKRLEDILLIRSVRDSVQNLSISKEEKEVLKATLNYLEEDIRLEIEKSYYAKEELENEGIDSFVDKVEIPVDQSESRHIIYADLDELDFSVTITKILLSFDEIFKDFNNSKKEIVLKALKEYVDFLTLQAKIRSNNQSLYAEEFRTSVR